MGQERRLQHDALRRNAVFLSLVVMGEEDEEAGGVRGKGVSVRMYQMASTTNLKTGDQEMCAVCQPASE